MEPGHRWSRSSSRPQRASSSGGGGGLGARLVAVLGNFQATAVHSNGHVQRGSPNTWTGQRRCPLLSRALPVGLLSGAWRLCSGGLHLSGRACSCLPAAGHTWKRSLWGTQTELQHFPLSTWTAT